MSAEAKAPLRVVRGCSVVAMNNDRDRDVKLGETYTVGGMACERTHEAYCILHDKDGETVGSAFIADLTVVEVPSPVATSEDSVGHIFRVVDATHEDQLMGWKTGDLGLATSITNDRKAVRIMRGGSIRLLPFERLEKWVPPEEVPVAPPAPEAPPPTVDELLLRAREAVLEASGALFETGELDCASTALERINDIIAIRAERVEAERAAADEASATCAEHRHRLYQETCQRVAAWMAKGEAMSVEELERVKEAVGHE